MLKAMQERNLCTQGILAINVGDNGCVRSGLLEPAPELFEQPLK